MSRAAKKKYSCAIVWPAITVVVLGIAAVMFSLVSCGNDWNAPAEVKSERNPMPATGANLDAAKAIYLDRCVNCHGVKGNGEGPEAEKLAVAPKDFTDSHAMNEVTDGELFWKIGVGRRPMPSFKNRLSEDDRWLLVDYIRTFSTRLAAPSGSTAAPGRP